MESTSTVNQLGDRMLVGRILGQSFGKQSRRRELDDFVRTNLLGNTTQERGKPLVSQLIAKELNCMATILY